MSKKQDGGTAGVAGLAYTPGPWSIQGGEIVGATGYRVASTSYRARRGSSQRVEIRERCGNERLIAAAPELAEVLRELLEVYDEHLGGMGTRAARDARLLLQRITLP